MVRVVSVENMRKSDAYTIENHISGRDLMYRAGQAIFESVQWAEPVAIVCGSGNNAGDGYVTASLLFEKGISCTLFLLSEKFSDDGRYYYEICKENGIPSVLCSPDTDFTGYGTVVDCIFGTGFRGKPEGIADVIIDKINACGAYIVSVDINSGLNGDNGLCEKCVISDLTVSIGDFKSGHFLNMAKDCIKTKINCDIGIELVRRAYLLLEKSDLKDIFGYRKNYSNKSTYGYTALIGGSLKYSGAAKLANLACAALRAGTGVVKLASPKGLINGMLPYVLESTLYPLSDDSDGNFKFDEDEIARLAGSVSVIAVGMGIGLSDDVKKLISYLLNSYDGVLIIDADGINALSQLDKQLLAESRARVIITPHVKEFSRISGHGVNDILENPIKLAEEFACENDCIVLLKGPATVITDGVTTYLSHTGCPGMATAGSGDVLSGIITAVCGYNRDNLLMAAAASAYLNGLAGEIAQERTNPISMTAGDTAACISDAVTEIIGSRA